MSRVEPIKKDEKRESQERNEAIERIDRTPGKAEGDEATVDEALRNQRNEGEQK